MSVDATKKPDNGIDVEAFNNFVDQVRREPAAGMASFGVVTKWEGGTRTRALTLAASNWPMEERYSWMKSVKSRSNCSRNYCGFSKKESSSESATNIPGTSTCV
jgi:hypothetical protein